MKQTIERVSIPFCAFSKKAEQNRNHCFADGNSNGESYSVDCCGADGAGIHGKEGSSNRRGMGVGWGWGVVVVVVVFTRMMIIVAMPMVVVVMVVMVVVE